MFSITILQNNTTKYNKKITFYHGVYGVDTDRGYNSFKHFFFKPVTFMFF